jgi:membrane protease YdiL (CAAX protease family)
MVFRGSQNRIGPFLSDNSRELLISSGSEIFLFALLFTLGWLASRASVDELLLRWRPGWWVVPLGMIYSVAIRLVMLIVLIVVTASLITTRAFTPTTLEKFATENRPNVEAIVDLPALQNDSSYFWLTLTLVSFVLAGLREEIWRASVLAGMRALWPRAFASTGGQLSAIILIAVVFGLMHLGMGPIAAALAGVIGCVLGLIMVLHRSIWPAVIAHGFFDATTFALLPWIADKLHQIV